MSEVYYYGTNYLLDETPAASLREEWIKTDFFHNSCFIPDEIIYELEGNRFLDINELKKNQIVVSYDILRMLKIVMAQAKVVKLYQNEGNGDAVLVATALALQNSEDQKIVKDEWVVVTSDKGVKALANNLSIRCIDKDEFYAILKDKVKEEEAMNSYRLKDSEK